MPNAKQDIEYQEIHMQHLQHAIDELVFKIKIVLFSAVWLRSGLGVENEGDNPIEWLKNSIPGTSLSHSSFSTT